MTWKKLGVWNLLYRCFCLWHDRRKWGDNPFFGETELKQLTQKKVRPKFYPERSRNLLIENINQSLSLIRLFSKSAINSKRKYLNVCVVFLYQPSGSPTYAWVTMCLPVPASYLYQCLRYITCFLWKSIVMGPFIY